MRMLIVQSLQLLEEDRRIDLVFISLGNLCDGGKKTHFNNILWCYNTHEVGNVEEKWHTCYALCTIAVTSLIILRKQVCKIVRFCCLQIQ
jgi:hypothetical protein